MPRKTVSPALRKMRNTLQRRLKEFPTYFTGDVIEKKAKMRYLEALNQSHLHSFAVTSTRGLSEWTFRKWLKEDEAFMEACNVVRLSFVDRLEYAVLCRSGYYGPERQTKYKAIDVDKLCSFIRIARYNGIYRRLKADGGTGAPGKTGGVSRDGEGAACSIVEEGGEGSLLSLPAAAPVPRVE